MGNVKIWYRNLRKAVIVTGKCTDTIGFSGLIQRMADKLSSPELGMLESTIPQMIDSITLDNAFGVAGYLNNICGYMVESRWHAGECFCSSLLQKTSDESSRKKLRECAELCFSTHDSCWQIWKQLGVAMYNDYKLPIGITQMMLESERQELLKDLFAQIFNNDRIILGKLKEILPQYYQTT